uniref:hypothetical protein n=1 Tax=Cellvibrio fontiphilus TaxID=1815559 RepID=UPI002B4BFA74|nr:hypothetical protein [Cellvibrio fontiphilus]
MTPGTEKHAQYQYDLVERAMEVTRPEFGDYLIEPYNEAPTAMRQAALLSEGRLMNMQWASPGTPIAKADVITVPLDILQGMLGFRVCLINRTQQAAFTKISSLAELRRIRVGQGIGWSDTRIYQHNGIPVLGASKLDYLFPMLASHRFDCLALGINEVSIKYAEIKAAFPELAIEQNLVLYYPFPIYIYVSKQTPELAERLMLGLSRLQQTGEFEQRLIGYFGPHLAPLLLPQRTIICLQSPYVSGANQCNMPINLPLLADGQ